MQTMAVSAKDLDVAPLLTSGPEAKIRWKFAVVGDHLVIGDTRSHIPLFLWLLAGPLVSRLPADVRAAEAFAEHHHILVATGDVLHTRSVKIRIHSLPLDRLKRDVRRVILQDLQPILEVLDAEVVYGQSEQRTFV